MFKLHTGRCKFVLDLVLMLWISWLVVYNSLFFTTKLMNHSLTSAKLYLTY